MLLSLYVINYRKQGDALRHEGVEPRHFAIFAAYIVELGTLLSKYVANMLSIV